MREELLLYYFLIYFRKTVNEVVNFNNFVENSNSILIIMPSISEEFILSLDVANYILSIGKPVKFLVDKNVLDLLPANYDHLNEEIGDSKFAKYQSYQRKKSFINKLKGFKFDTVIDLSRSQTSLLGILCAGLLSAKYKVGFNNDKALKVYNIIIPPNCQTDSRSLYDNYLNCLKMLQE